MKTIPTIITAIISEGIENTEISKNNLKKKNRLP